MVEGERSKDLGKGRGRQIDTYTDRQTEAESWGAGREGQKGGKRDPPGHTERALV